MYIELSRYLIVLKIVKLVLIHLFAYLSCLLPSMVGYTEVYGSYAGTKNDSLEERQSSSTESFTRLEHSRFQSSFSFLKYYKMLIIFTSDTHPRPWSTMVFMGVHRINL